MDIACGAIDIVIMKIRFVEKMIMRVVMRSIWVGALLLVQSSCIGTKNTRPWTQVVCDGGNVFVLDGEVTYKTGPLLSIDGTFQKFTYPVKRSFVLRAANETEPISRHVLGSSLCDSFYFDYFAETDQLFLSFYDDAVIKCLRNGKSVRLGGKIGNVSFPQQRFALIATSENEPRYLYNKVNGNKFTLSEAARNFIGQSYSDDIFVDYVGRYIIKITDKRVASGFSVTVWDLERNEMMMRTPDLFFKDGFAQPCVAAFFDGNLVFIYFREHFNDDRYYDYEVGLVQYNGDTLTRSILFAGNMKEASVKIMMDDPRHAGIITTSPAGAEWTCEYRRVDLATGEVSVPTSVR